VTDKINGFIMDNNAIQTSKIYGLKPLIPDEFVNIW